MTIEYDSAAVRSPAINELIEIWRYRDLLKLLISNSIKTRYKRSVLGIVWTLLNPLLNTLVLTIALSQLFRFDVDNYPVYILSGLLVWNFFSQTTMHAMNQLVWGSSLIKRIYIPRSVFAVSVAGNSLVNFFLSLIPLFVVMLFMRQPFTVALLWLPVPIFLLAVFTLGLTLLISTLAVFFVDVVDMYSILLSAWFYLTPIIYPLEIVPERFAPFIRFNPITIMVEMFRAPVFFGNAPSLSLILQATVIAFVTLIVGWLFFTSKSNEFAYRI